MKFILYSHIDQDKIDSSLGLPEYSYYYVLKEFRLALEQLGTVVIAREPEREVDSIYKECEDRGESCVFFAFSPPNKAPLGLACPSICVFAWEFENIPNEAWDADPANDWRYVLKSYGRAITLSEYSTQAVKAAMGEDFPVVAIPVPVWDRFSPPQQNTLNKLPAPVIHQTSLEVAGHIVDSQFYTISSETLKLHRPEQCFLMPPWDGQVLEMDCSRGGGGDGYLVGFYEPESWGIWSKVEEPWVLLPCIIDGDIKLKFMARGYGHNVNREVCVKVGDQIQNITLTEGFAKFELDFSLPGPVTTVKILGLDLTSVQNIADPRTMGLGLESLTIERADLPEARKLMRAAQSKQQAGNAVVDYHFKSQAPELSYLVGFYDGEDWGVWSRTTNPAVLLTPEVQGQVTVEFSAIGYGANVGRKIRVELGDQTTTIALTKRKKTYKLGFRLEMPAEVLRFCGLDVSPSGAEDPRTMGIGLSHLRAEAARDNGAPVPHVESKSTLRTELSGVVYTSVFNPGDNRKNWQDMLTAFIYAFREIEDATLVLKMTNNSVSSYLGSFHYFLQRLAPFKCRVVIIHGYLSDSDYQRLIDSSSYYVNTSHCEGLCLPLMEFMACGKPGIAPGHTSMADYVTDSANFVIQSSVEPGIWPHDPRDVFRALRYRLNWWSLVGGFTESYRVAKHEVEKYSSMSTNSKEQMKSFCSIQRVQDMLAAFLQSEFER